MPSFYQDGDAPQRQWKYMIEKIFQLEISERLEHQRTHCGLPIVQIIVTEGQGGVE